MVRHLGSFAVSEGSSSVTWDSRGDGGATLPDGVYYLHLDSTDPNRNLTSAETAVTLDSTPPSAAIISPPTITPQQSTSFAVSDTGSGLQSVSLRIDGEDVQDYGGWSGSPVPSSFSYCDYGDWSLGAHTWEIQATDNAGNRSDQSGSFTVANPPPAKPKPTATLPKPPATVRCPSNFEGMANDKGTPIGGISGKHMTCRQSNLAIKRGRLIGKQGHYGFESRGFRCRVLKQWTTGRGRARITTGENIGCSAQNRSFSFGWAT